MCGADVHIQCKEKPQCMRRWVLFPNGKFAHHTFELNSGKIPIVYPAPIHFFTAGEPRGDEWYFRGAPARWTCAPRLRHRRTRPKWPGPPG